MTQTQPRRALVVDDAAEFRTLVSGILRRDGYDVSEATNGAEAVAVARGTQPAVVILDVSMPDVDGVEACRQIRSFSDAYIMMLTSRRDEVDLLVGLAVGADGYMTKPFSPRELTAHVSAGVRRNGHRSASAANGDAAAGEAAASPDGSSEPATGASLIRRYGALVIDPVGRTVEVDGEEVSLTRTEFDLLEVLTSNPRMVFRRETLLERVWDENYFGPDHVVDVHMANLRRKLGDNSKNPRFFRTLRGVGYRMIPQ